MKPTQDQSLFDSYATDYDLALEKGISVSGEDKEYFAAGRISWLAKCLSEIGEKPQTIMDYGCGTGSATPFVSDKLNPRSLIGVDPSRKSLQIATQVHGSERAVFLPFEEYEPHSEIDLVFTSGVFHHINPPDRPEALNYIYKSLRPSGIFAFWENNPWNPGTQYVMSRISFDRDAVKVSSLEGKRILKEAGFQVISTDYLFIFPNLLRGLRKLEPAVSRFPLGAQYQILARKV